MPVIRHLPAIKVIKGFRGILDFYCWKNLYCVRKWPRIPYANRTATSLASAALFGAISAGYALLGGTVKDLLAEDAADHNRTGRDLFISATLGHLHEASMSDFLDLLTQATAHLAILKDLANALNAIGTDELRVKPGYDGADYFPLLIDAQRHLQADILASALPTNAATDAHQDTMITALQLIDNLIGALESVHTDRLLVRGMDQLFTFKDTWSERLRKTNADEGDNTLVSATVPAGEIRVLTHLAAYNDDSVCTRILLATRLPPVYEVLKADLAVPAKKTVDWQGYKPLGQDWDLYATFYACTAGDDLTLALGGFKMTLEP